jgi:GNAT superfamily N-acetyltransferase
MPRPIVDLASDTRLVDPTAQLLLDVFRNRTEDWQDFDSAREEVLASLAPDRISRVMIDDSGLVVGWIGGVPIYGGRVWELHPLVVSDAHRRRGLGRALAAGPTSSWPSALRAEPRRQPPISRDRHAIAHLSAGLWAAFACPELPDCVPLNLNVARRELR